MIRTRTHRCSAKYVQRVEKVTDTFYSKFADNVENKHDGKSEEMFAGMKW